MMPTNQGSIRIFRVSGINVFLHWSWFLVAAIELSHRKGSYTSPVWNVLEYLSLFVIVTMHEFGHALACRQVGGRAEQIVLWPLGGVAYVDPPQRPGATLWSIAAGPLVNVVLFPILTLAGMVGRAYGFAEAMPNAHTLLRTVWFINLILLIFNLLPIYPLDGGQILRSLLWFVFGRARSLMIATIIGLAGVAALVVLAIWARSIWIGVVAAFILMNCWRGFQQSRMLAQLDALPRREGFACPACHSAPQRGALWMCSQCRTPFDTFESLAGCPHCGAQFAVTRCVNCGENSPISAWAGVSAIPPAV